MRSALVPQLGENFEYLAFQGMMQARHPDLGGKVSEVGSVSWVSLIISNGTGWNGCWSNESVMEPF
jgi:hypothetical protein